MEERDPSFWQIHESFLTFIRKFHAAKNYEKDFRKIAFELGVKFEEAHSSKEGNSFKMNGLRVSLIDPNVSPERLRFTAWHELSHHLFEMAQEGELKAFLRDQFSDGQARDLEEELCYESAALLLMPDPIYERSLSEYSYSPLAVFDLSSKTGASLSAAVRRLIFSHTYDVHAVLFVKSSGRVFDSIAFGASRGKYSIGRDFILPDEHPLRQFSERPMSVRRVSSPVPFKHSVNSRKWESPALTAFNHADRAIAFLMKSYPPDASTITLPLFNLSDF